MANLPSRMMRKRRAIPAASAAVLCIMTAVSPAVAQDRPGQQGQDWRAVPQNVPPSDSGLQARVYKFRSAVDGEEYPYTVCATGDANKPRPLVLVVTPGGHALRRAMINTQRWADILRRHDLPCVVVRPTGRGPGSLYMNYGEVDLFEAVEDVKKRFIIDPDRILIWGISMGGAATWYLTSHYPDLFAAASSIAGYNDYRLWTKAGGWTYHLQPWEEASWKARSAALLPENLRHLPFWIIHGGRDRALGGGVPVEHARQMYARMKERGFDVKYTEVPEAGHGVANSELIEQVLVWLVQHRRKRDVEDVSLVTYGLRHNRSRWVQVDEIETYGERAEIHAMRKTNTRLEVRVRNVRTFSLGPLPSISRMTVTLGEQQLVDLDLRETQTLHRTGDGHWRTGKVDLLTRKHHGRSGPSGDLFFDGTIFVTGTTGTEDEAYYLRAVANYMKRAYHTKNGGVHRGGIQGENYVYLRVVPDSDLREEVRNSMNIVLFGTPRTNSVWKAWADRIPVRFEKNALELNGRRFESEAVALFAVFPHPEHPERYVAIHGGLTPDAIVDGSHLNLGLLPDYIVYDGAKVITWGFWSGDWGWQD